ncbi:hypothetical protein J2854_004603 [Agrobacterium tumefaciens]|nr:nuclear transport factor 2 family protein [Agrobacterium tumefaciens]MDP9857393.1 hypothetical protein [Agrobacterium tumefaciens]
MTIKLPKAIEAYFEADRTGSPDTIAATFTENGIVKDKGKTHRGRDAIREWMADEAQQYSYTVEPFLITARSLRTLRATSRVARLTCVLSSPSRATRLLNWRSPYERVS